MTAPRPARLDPARFSARARKAQQTAAAPNVSAWVAANAGTGKTQVLTDRVLRLLLSGTSPERILALTYTKAASAEMSKRVFDRLAVWVTMSEPGLRERLLDLLGRVPTAEETARARTLFALAIETPGGLKVQTIHAFCERLLQRFPLEAGIPPGFSILDDATALELRREATDAVLFEATCDPASPLAVALSDVIAYAADDSFDALLRDALAHRGWLATMAALSADGGTRCAEVYRDALDLDVGETLEEARAARAAFATTNEFARLIDILREGSKNDQDQAERFAAFGRARGEIGRTEALRAAFLTTAGEPRKSLITKSLADDYPEAKDRLDWLKDRFLELDSTVRKHELVRATLALARLAHAVMNHYAAAKARRAALDFDDLIVKTNSLLGQAGATDRASASEWVLYKLDGGLDHILVDEAQDTSPSQWALIRSLAGEFFAGTGARDEILRTLFAVGDEKQSIYGFQGAAPEMFARMGRLFEDLAAGSARKFERVPLDVSFRTTPPVLAAVDAVFADPRRTPGLTAADTVVEHLANRAGQAGLVELWPIEAPEPKSETSAWRPLDEPTVTSPVTRLATRIADLIARWLDKAKPEILASENRPVRAGDILILVARRAPFAPAMVQALKARDIPVAGADRLALTNELVVQDLMVLGDFLALPEDDLALATVLKSPLFDLDDAALIDLAPGRKGLLWSALLDRAKTDARFSEAAEQLKKWRSEADFLPPYEFFASLLERDDGCMRRRLIGRLGPDATEPLDEFLNLALAYDEQAPPSLQGFLTWLRATDREIKRDMDKGRDEVRVMTVHGSKGLEAPIVFLPDTCAGPNGNRPASLLEAAVSAGMDDAEICLWPVKGSSKIDTVVAARSALKQREFEERNRLLYVAMTRPRDRLYVAGYRGVREPPPDCWYRLIEGALRPRMAAAQSADGREILRYESPQTAVPEQRRGDAAAADTALAPPEWALRRAPREVQLAIPLAPSRLAPLETDDSGEAVEPTRPARAEPAGVPPRLGADAHRFMRGTLSHALLEHLPNLPAAGRAAAAKVFLDTRARELPARTRTGIATEVLAVLADPAFAPIFGPGSRPEVPIVAAIPRPGGGLPLKLTGQIDRLLATDHEVLIVDYKTNRPPPLVAAAVADTYLLQLAAYRLAIAAIYPHRQIRAAIIWTDGCRLMELPSPMLDAAERRLWSLDIAELAAAHS